jgi:hypothetical protein
MFLQCWDSSLAPDLKLLYSFKNIRTEGLAQWQSTCLSRGKQNKTFKHHQIYNVENVTFPQFHYLLPEDNYYFHANLLFYIQNKIYGDHSINNFFLVCLAIVGFELRVSCLLGRCCILEPLHHLSCNFFFLWYWGLISQPCSY